MLNQKRNREQKQYGLRLIWIGSGKNLLQPPILPMTCIPLFSSKFHYKFWYDRNTKKSHVSIYNRCIWLHFTTNENITANFRSVLWSSSGENEREGREWEKEKRERVRVWGQQEEARIGNWEIRERDWMVRNHSGFPLPHSRLMKIRDLIENSRLYFHLL